MWITDLDDQEAISIFGPHGVTIATLSRASVTRQRLPVGSDAYGTEDAAGLGPNGGAVALFLENWRHLPWRRHDGAPLPVGWRARHLSSWEEVGDPMASRQWITALRAAGFQATDPLLTHVWDVAMAIGLAVGGPNARFLAAGSAGELAQIDKDLHFFLDLMPWLWRGYWVCGWDDATGIPHVL